LSILTRLNWVDVISIIVIFRISYVGSLMGVAKQLIPCLSIFCSLMISLYYYDAIAQVIVQKSGLSKSVCDFFVYAVIVMVISGTAQVVKKYMPIKLPDNIIPFERVIGTSMGFFRAFVVMGLIAIGLMLAPVSRVDKAVKDSASAKLILKNNLFLYSETVNLIKGYKDFDRLTSASVYSAITREKDYKLHLFNFDFKKKGRFYKEEY